MINAVHANRSLPSPTDDAFEAAVTKVFLFGDQGSRPAGSLCAVQHTNNNAGGEEGEAAMGSAAGAVRPTSATRRAGVKQPHHPASATKVSRLEEIMKAAGYGGVAMTSDGSPAPTSSMTSVGADATLSKARHSLIVGGGGGGAHPSALHRPQLVVKHPHDVEKERVQSLRSAVDERVAALKARRQDIFLRRIRADPNSMRVEGSNNVGLSSSSQGAEGPPHHHFTVGFDSRHSILDAAKSACLAAAPPPPFSHSGAVDSLFSPPPTMFTLTGRSPARHATFVDPSHPFAGDGEEDKEADRVGSVLLRQRRAELTLHGMPLIGAGFHALLSAAGSSPVESVVILAEMVGKELSRRSEFQRKGTPSQDRPASAASQWSVVHQPGEEADDQFEDLVQGSAVRLRGRPQSAPLMRRERPTSPKKNDDVAKPPIKQVSSAELRMKVAATGAPPIVKEAIATTSVDQTAERPASRAHSHAKAAKEDEKPHVSSSAGAVVMAREPCTFGLMDPRGLIGVSVDPRFAPSPTAASLTPAPTTVAAIAASSSQKQNAKRPSPSIESQYVLGPGGRTLSEAHTTVPWTAPPSTSSSSAAKGSLTSLIGGGAYLRGHSLEPGRVVHWGRFQETEPQRTQQKTYVLRGGAGFMMKSR